MLSQTTSQRPINHTAFINCTGLTGEQLMLHDEYMQGRFKDVHAVSTADRFYLDNIEELASSGRLTQEDRQTLLRMLLSSYCTDEELRTEGLKWIISDPIFLLSGFFESVTPICQSSLLHTVIKTRQRITKVAESTDSEIFWNDPMFI